MRRLRTPLDIALLFTIIGCLVGVWASYDRATSWLQFVVILIAILVYYGIMLLGQTPGRLTTLIDFILLGAAALALYYVTQHDFQSETKFSLVRALGLALNDILPPFQATSLHPNNVAGVLEIALPLNVGLLANQQSTRGRLNAAFVITALFIGCGLVMTSSRGAWAALGLVGAVAVTAWLLMRTSERQHVIHGRAGRSRLSVLFSLLLLCTVAALLLVVVVSSRGEIGSLLSPFVDSEGRVPRGDLYAQVRDLARDYTFTGAGLGMFPMVYSTYSALSTVYLLPHAHNWLLQTWMDQGLPGVAGYIGLVLGLGWWVLKRYRDLNELAKAGIAATMVMWLHGIIDAPLWYSLPTLSLQFLPLGIALSAAGIDPARTSLHPRRSATWPLALVMILIALGAIRESKPMAVRWLANLGSVAQTKIELAPYRFPERLVEFVRQDTDMAEPQASFYQVLALDRGDITANQRLAEIALARAEYQTARNYAESAFERDPGNATTWELLGDAYLGQGDLERAYTFWSRVVNAASKLEIEADVRYERNGDLQRAGWARTLARRAGGQ